MKNLKLIVILSLFSIGISHIAIPAEIEYIEDEFDTPIIDKKAKMKYTGMRYKLEPIKTPDEIAPENLAREEKLKKFRKQEKAAKKIQSFWRSKKEDEKRNQKIEDFKRNRAAIKLQRATRNYLQEKRIEKFKKSIENFANQDYSKFKELICTSDYLTKTDWIYKFIETMENKTIFQRDKNENIDPEKFTPEFKQKISNPDDWLSDKILQHLSKFHATIYGIFIDKAVEQIIKYGKTWTYAVSAPTPKGHGSFQEEGTPLFPKVYKCSNCPYNHLILGKMFTKIFEKELKIVPKLHLGPTVVSITDPVLDADGHTAFKDVVIEMFGQTDLITIMYDVNDSDFDEGLLIMKTIEKNDVTSHLLNQYLNQLGLEISPEEAKAALISDDYLKPIEPVWDDNTDTLATWEKKWELYYEKLNKFEDEQEKFIQDHINWTSSARQTFLLGQLIFDKIPQAFEELGGQEWLSKQPQDIQKALKSYIENLASIVTTDRLKRMKNS